MLIYNIYENKISYYSDVLLYNIFEEIRDHEICIAINN